MRSRSSVQEDGPAGGCHAHGTELPPGQNALLYSMGFVVATGCLHAAGIGIGTIHRWSWGQAMLRVAGAVVAVGGICFMWRALAWVH